MMYRYVAYTADKRQVSGTIDSITAEMAEDSLYRAGFYRIIKLQRAGSSINWKATIFGQRKVSRQALLDFTNELAILLESGLTLLMGLRHMQKQVSQGVLRATIANLAIDLQAGIPFHQALAKYPHVFSETYTSVVEANEKAGTLEMGLKQLAKELKQQIELRSHIQRAITQPAIIVALAIAVVVLMAVVVLPPLVEVFRQFGSSLPLTTRVLIGITDFVAAYKYVLIGVILFVVLALVILFRQQSTRKSMDRMMLQLPLIGNILIWHNTARFTRTMSNLLRAGILLPDTINILIKTSGNMYFRQSLAEVRRQLVQGESLSSAIGKNKVFPALLAEMSSVGEASGELETSLAMVADYFENKTEKRINQITALLEPALMLGIGLVVGFIAVSVVSTIYGLIGSLK